MKIAFEEEKQTKKKKKDRASSEPVAEKKKHRVRARTNTSPLVTDLELMKEHNFMSVTESTQTKILPLTPLGKNMYEVEPEPIAHSAILKLVVKTNQTNPLSLDWTHILWNVTQMVDILPPDVLVTFTRMFEKVGDEIATKRIKNRHRLATLSSSSKKSRRAQNAFVRHDAGLVEALNTGDSVVAFGAEAIITAKDEKSLERAMDALQNYVRANDETRGLSYELDINHQLRPFIIAGPNTVNKNKDVYVEMSSSDAAVSALFVDSGGDRTLGSEYVGVSVGKLIRSHAAYSLQNQNVFIVGNSSIDKTHTLAGERNIPSQLYWSHAISRSYLLDGKKVTHFVLDNQDSVKHLMNFGLDDKNKMSIDVSKGFLNILEVIGETDGPPDRIVGRFNTHLNNIIALLAQFRDKNISTTDDFASITRKILTDFFITNKYYVHQPLSNLDNIRLTGDHDQYKTLADFGAWVAQRRVANTDMYIKDALAELDTIVNTNILPTIPALNTITHPIVDTMLDVKYRVVDVTGLNIGAITSVDDPTTNIMMISYLNVILPSLQNGDVIFIHGITKIEGIAKTIQDMIANAGVSVDIVYTERNQNAAIKADEIIENSMDLTIVDLYDNRIDKLVEPLSIAKDYANMLSEQKGSFYLKTNNGSDYIFLDDIL